MVLFSNPRELQFLERIHKEVHRLFFPEVRFFVRIIRPAGVDPLYGEDADEAKHFVPEPIFIPAYIEYNIERRRILELFGKDLEWNIVIWFARRYLIEKDLKPKAGDVIIAANSEFEIKEERLESQVHNQPLWFDRAYAMALRREADSNLDWPVQPSPVGGEELGEGEEIGGPNDATGTTPPIPPGEDSCNVYPYDYDYPEAPYDNVNKTGTDRLDTQGGKDES